MHINNPLKNPNPIGELCIRPGCDTKARTRGLCDACYRAAQYVMKKYNLDWGKLMKKGKCLERARKPSERVAWMIDWMKPRGRRPKGAK